MTLLEGAGAATERVPWAGGRGWARESYVAHGRHRLSAFGVRRRPDGRAGEGTWRDVVRDSGHRSAALAVDPPRVRPALHDFGGVT